MYWDGIIVNEELAALVREADAKSFEGRLSRLEFLLENLGEGYTLFPAIVLQYFEETKLCFYEGAFVASILMVSATFEELLRQIYREINQMEKANARGLSELVENAICDDLISSEEMEELTNLRKLRNKFTYINIGFGEGSKKNKKTLLDYALLWGDPREQNLPIEELSKDAIRVFARLLPEVCNRFWGNK